ncbi:MAG: YihY/virulence factor BrkB family protein [Candidatus Saccharicenans sp.]|jgi:membrane protein|nr:YihY/virulence factor BrkB family protein [Candidatus Saccharicenans sp.]MDH7493552.1 YihY/virulence factor BrkB family protein [Candidatus Saccharicenans sp.]
MALKPFKILAASFKRFNDDRCWTASIVISYFSLLCVVPLVALFYFLGVKILGSAELLVRSLNIFTEEFFARMDPAFFKRLQALGGNVSNLGWFGLVGSLVAASFLFSNLIATINQIFRAKYHRSFFYNRLIEYVTMMVIGVILLLSISITAVWTGLQKSLRESPVASEFINPYLINFLNNFFFQYLLPYGLTFLFLFTLYKFIPEVRVHTRSALLAAAIAAFFWELFKRGFAFYVIHFSAVGIVLSKILAGTLTSVIFFLLWISASLVIMLWGAELAAVMNEYLDSLPETGQKQEPQPQV